MLDQWFKNDLQDIYASHSVAVFIDESGEAEFLLKTVADEYSIQQANSELAELEVKYRIEKAQPSLKKFLVYTRSGKGDLKFIREYCETCGCLEIRDLQNYIKDKVHRTMNLNINLSKAELIAAAKISVGKDHTYWMDLSHKGATEIFDLHKELLPFMHNPNTYSQKYDPQLRETFYGKVSEMLGQDYLCKPATTLASEVVKAILDGLAKGCCDKTLEAVYRNWLDSVTYCNSFKEYLDNYTLIPNLNIWKVSVDHPFRQVDERWLAEVGANISDKKAILNKLSKLHHRNSSKQAAALGIIFWSDVIALLEFDPKNIDYLSSFGECVEFYKKHFCKLDTAIRNLYAEFSHKAELLEPFQELYKEYVSVFLDKWFKHWNGYQENQTGIIQRIIDAAGELKTAIIVGDGVSYEMAELVAAKVNSARGNALYKLTKDSILADIPSETENNMSRIYMANGITEAVHSKRVDYLIAQNPAVSIEFIGLDEVNDEARPSQCLICTYKDIDALGEKLQQKALKHFPKNIDSLAEKISLLLASGYGKVCLIADHGFVLVLTGVLSNADKISVTLEGEFYTAERYIRTKHQQTALLPEMIEAKKSYKSFEYLYFAKNTNPFKTSGVYGFSHGGVSPQELVTPYFCWERTGAVASALAVSIDNKRELQDVTGELFLIKIRAAKGSDDLFSGERKVYLIFFANKVQVGKSEVFAIKREERVTKEYTFDGYSEIEVQLLDAESKQQLDRAAIKQNKDRDLGGLL